MQRKLRIIRDNVEHVTAPLAERRDWPCAKGCDECCRRLAEIPRISRVEWEAVSAAIQLLDHDVQRLIALRVQELIETPPTSLVTCPLLNREEAACLIYNARPVACRSYGFYLARDGGRWCHRIEALNQAGSLDGSILGNHDALERALERELGETRSLIEWWQSDQTR